jgi:hypothetical protein
VPTNLLEHSLLIMQLRWLGSEAERSTYKTGRLYLLLTRRYLLQQRCTHLLLLVQVCARG